MSNTVNINIAASDNGSIDKVTAKTKNLNKELTKAQTTSGSLGKPASGTAAYNKAKTQTDDMFEYRQARGGRGTGAEGRDFAKQSQGLGGLVHVYATFAANIFALTAAFGALSKAADYSNMVKGLDQLGAASGRNLSAMAKNMVDLTDGAISLKEAMAATAQGSAAGLNGEQLERMSKVARTASLALGRDMADSLNRLSRGISKIEPELIDELGIFVKVDKAAQDYARTLGKTALSLTDFERRQAYANAVLEEGEKKFSAIKLDANPYSKLEASFINIMYLGGELINTVLKPIVTLLATSPVALGASILAFASMLLSKAIPALKGWRDNIREAAADAEKLATSKVDAALEAKIDRLNKIKYAAEGKAEVQQEALAYAEENLKNRSESAGKKIAKSVQNILAKDVRLIDDKDLATIDKMASKNTKLAGSYKEIAVAIREAKTAELAYSDQVRRNQEILSKKPLATSVEGMNLKEAQSLQKRSLGMGIVSSSVEKFSSMGWLAGWSEFDKKIGEAGEQMSRLDQKMGMVNTGILRLKTAFGMGIVYVSKFINAFGFIGAAISAVVVIFQLLDSALSGNSKQLEEFKGSVDTFKTSLTGLDATIDLIRNKDPFEKLSVQSIQAQANAIEELSNSITKMAKSLEQTDKYANGWDKFIDGWKSVVGADIRSVATNNISIGIEETLNNTLDSINKSGFTGKLAKILNTDDLSKSGISKALSGLNTEKFKNTLKELALAQQQFSKENQNIANKLSGYNESIESTQKSMQNLSNSFIPSDAMSKFGSDQMAQAARLAEALKDPETALIALSDAATDFNILKLFPPEATKNILATKDALISLRESIGAYDQAILATQKRLSEVAAGPGDKFIDENGFTQETSGKQTQQYKDIKAQETFLKNLRVEDLKRVEELQVELNGTAMQMYEAGAKRVGQSLQTAMALGAIEAKKTLAGAVGGVEGVKIQEKLTRDAIGVQLKAIDTQLDLILETKRLSLQMEEANAWSKFDKDFREGKDTTKLEETIASLGRQKEALQGPANKVLGNIRGGTNDVKLGLSSTADQIVSSLEKKAGLSSQIQQSKYREELAAIEDQFKKIQEKKEIELENLKIQEESLALSYTSSGLYSEELENLVKTNKLSIQKAQLDKESAGFNAEEAKLTYIINKLGESSYEGKLAKQRLDYISLQNAEKLANIESKNAIENLKMAREAESRRVSAIAEDIDMQLKYQDILTTNATIIEEASGRRDFILNKILDTTKLQLQQEKELLDLRSKRNAETDSKIIEAYDKKISRQEEYNALQLENIKLQAEYQEALVKTENSLRDIEKGIGDGKDQIGLTYQDFSNKITDLVNSSKSAADAFNTGFINAIDSSIDEFYNLLKEGKLTFDSMSKFLRNSISDAFYDMAKQTIKNYWKDTLKKFLPPSDKEKAAEGIKTLNDTITAKFPELTAAINNLSKSDFIKNTGAGKSLGKVDTGSVGIFDNNGMGTTANDKAMYDMVNSNDYKNQDVYAAKLNAEEGFTESLVSTTAKQSALVDTQSNAITQFGKTISTLPGVFGSFGQYITMFGQFITMMSASSAVSGASSGAGGILSSLAGAFSSTGGSSMASGAGSFFSMATLASAKGNVFPGAEGLSKYSNSIVSSPTLFAFAKGGTPNVGLMGEAGPEAIIPLKRDAQGNLGVGSTSSNNSKTTNLTINVNSQNGNPAEIRRSAAAAARTIASTLNGAQRYG